MQIKGWKDSATIKGICTETKEGFSRIFVSILHVIGPLTLVRETIDSWHKIIDLGSNTCVWSNC
jgi:hypothetical protein